MSDRGNRDASERWTTTEEESLSSPQNTPRTAVSKPVTQNRSTKTSTAASPANSTTKATAANPPPDPDQITSAQENGTVSLSEKSRSVSPSFLTGVAVHKDYTVSENSASKTDPKHPSDPKRNPRDPKGVVSGLSNSP